MNIPHCSAVVPNRPPAELARRVREFLESNVKLTLVGKRLRTAVEHCLLFVGCPQPSSCRACKASLRVPGKLRQATLVGKRLRTAVEHCLLFDGCPQPSSCRACEASLRVPRKLRQATLVGKRLRTAVEQYCSAVVPNRPPALLARRV